ncbi:hypothetical protein C0J52_13055 [Blattella germanica]|nr:hypothetical protein C0J52_13055 [Blattella germanica]
MEEKPQWWKVTEVHEMVGVETVEVVECTPYSFTIMKLTTSRYFVMLLVQFGLMLVDILVNCFSDFARKSSVVVLLLFIIQDVCLIFALISLAGLVEVLYNRFRATIIISTVYMLLTIGLHSWTLSERWGHPMEHIWPNGLLWLYTIQRILAVFYYYLYKRSILRISDPRFYEDFDWANHQPTVIISNILKRHSNLEEINNMSVTISTINLFHGYASSSKQYFQYCSSNTIWSYCKRIRQPVFASIITLLYKELLVYFKRKYCNCK